MSNDALKKISDMVSEAHAQVQAAHQHINPVVGLRQGMRDVGIPADTITIDCLQRKKRILLVLHDEHPGILLYQFTTTGDELIMQFNNIALESLNTETIVSWVVEYFN